MGLDDTVILIVETLLDQLPSVGREEAIIVAQVGPLRVPLGVIRHQPSGNILLRLVRVSHLLDRVEAVSPY